ncbi:DNA replication complex GINS protein PSF2 [Centruroides vittatus]|uniref:DNA replication complex GINS protein PSF2 n=1 Tax=Centruroides vittatus TaxID=120091 RepID=UPI00350FEE95
MDPSVIEFTAEKEYVTIVPNFSHGKIYLISGDIGPFTPSIPVKVPLWIALNLKQRLKCRLIPPEWMDIEKLENKKQEEIESRYFTPMPSKHFREIAQLLLDVASNDIPNADEIQTLVKDIWDIRLAKLRSSIDAFIKSEETHAQLNYLTTMEINTVRPLLTLALNHLCQLKSVPVSEEEMESQD